MCCVPGLPDGRLRKHLLLDSTVARGNLRPHPSIMGRPFDWMCSPSRHPHYCVFCGKGCQGCAFLGGSGRECRAVHHRAYLAGMGQRSESAAKAALTKDLHAEYPHLAEGLLQREFLAHTQRQGGGKVVMAGAATLAARSGSRNYNTADCCLLWLMNECKRGTKCRFRHACPPNASYTELG